VSLRCLHLLPSGERLLCLPPVSMITSLLHRFVCTDCHVTFPAPILCEEESVQPAQLPVQQGITAVFLAGVGQQHEHSCFTRCGFGTPNTTS
jgi:hypothetical protein